jgi:hypothetical protein
MKPFQVGRGSQIPIQCGYRLPSHPERVEFSVMTGGFVQKFGQQVLSWLNAVPYGMVERVVNVEKWSVDWMPTCAPLSMSIYSDRRLSYQPAMSCLVKLRIYVVFKGDFGAKNFVVCSSSALRFGSWELWVTSALICRRTACEGHSHHIPSHYSHQTCETVIACHHGLGIKAWKDQGIHSQAVFQPQEGQGRV